MSRLTTRNIISNKENYILSIFGFLIFQTPFEVDNLNTTSNLSNFLLLLIIFDLFLLKLTHYEIDLVASKKSVDGGLAGAFYIIKETIHGTFVIFNFKK